MTDEHRHGPDPEHGHAHEHAPGSRAIADPCGHGGGDAHADVAHHYELGRPNARPAPVTTTSRGN